MISMVDKKIVGLMLFAVVAFSVYGNGQTESSGAGSQEPEFVLKAQGTGATGDPAFDTLYLGFGEKVAQKSNGRIKVQFYPSQSLAPDREYLEMMKQGIADIFMGSNSTMGLLDPKWDVLGLPYAIPDIETLWKLLDGEPGKALAKSIQSQGLRVLAWAYSPSRQFSNNKREIRKPSDLKGLKIRSPENRPTEEWMRSLGCDPVVLSFPEMMPALQQGVIDGQDVGIVSVKMMNLHQVQKFWTLDDHLYFCIPVMISEKTWSKLPPDLQKVVQEAAVESSLEQRKVVAEAMPMMIEFAEQNGVKVTRLTPNEKKAFEDSARPIYPKFASEIGVDVMDLFFSSMGKTWK